MKASAVPDRRSISRLGCSTVAEDRRTRQCRQSRLMIYCLRNKGGTRYKKMGSDSQPPQPPFANALAQYLAVAAYNFEGKWFRNQEINIDGYSFSNCRFDSCTITTSKGSFSFDHCYLSNCRIIYGEAAQKTVRLYIWGAQMGGEAAASLYPISNPDGTYTIP
jgi:hypothetical protein